MRVRKPTSSQRRHMVDAALGNRPFDTLIQNIQLLNVFSGEIYPAEIGISEGFVAIVTEPGILGSEALAIVDGGGAFALPGFIDSHVHIESSMLTPSHFAEIVIPRGTTTVVTDPHEIANVMGLRGVEYMLEAGLDLPMYQFALAPSCVPAVPGLESSGAEFRRAEMARMLDMDGILGIAEVMDYEGVLCHSERISEILDLAVERDTFVQGHFFGDDPCNLAAYICGGPVSNHEFMTGPEARLAIRAGMTVDARDSSFTRDIASIVSGLEGTRTPTNLSICTDDRHPEEIRRAGHIDDCLKSAVAAGLDSVDAVRAATLNTARLYGLKRLGAIAPGYVANINLVEDLNDFNVDRVFFEGRLVAEAGSLTEPVNSPVSSLISEVESENTVYISGLSEADFQLTALVDNGILEVRVIRHLTEETALTEVAIESVEVRNGRVNLETTPQLNYIAILNRHGRAERRTVALVENFHLTKGAVAGTVCHDSHNLALVYTNTADALRAAEEIKRIGGGLVFVHGDIVESYALPVAGLMSRLQADALIPEVERMNSVLREAGIRAENPVMRLATVALPVLPSVKITDMGLVDTATQEFLEFFM